jgi:DNA-binding MurR/RpiR family transcriptional regulator
LHQHIIEHFSHLSRKQKALARFILDNEYFVAFASASEVGAKVGTSAATVVRFGQALGYDGYAELQADIQTHFPRPITTVQRVEERLAQPIAGADIPAQVFAADIRNIERTMALLNLARFEAAVEAIQQATRVLVVGGDLSGPLAAYFAHSLHLIGVPARAITTGGVPLALALAELQATDLLVGISVWRYLRETVQAMHKAREVGARRLAITDSEVSPLAQLADYAFITVNEGVAHSSLSAPLSLIHAFITALFFKAPEQSLRALQQVNAAYRATNLLFSE